MDSYLEKIQKNLVFLANLADSHDQLAVEAKTLIANPNDPTLARKKKRDSESESGAATHNVSENSGGGDISIIMGGPDLHLLASGATDADPAVEPDQATLIAARILDIEQGQIMANLENDPFYRYPQPHPARNSLIPAPMGKPWSEKERELFEDGRMLYGDEDPYSIAAHVGTRNASQVRQQLRRITRQEAKGKFAS
jgi:hypothetical protein